MKINELQNLHGEQKLIIRNCNNPLVIFNKGVIPYLLRCTCFFIKDKIHYLTPSDINALAFGQSNTIRKFSYFRRSIQKNTNTIFDIYTVDTDGCRIPLYTIVGCGKCLACRNRKANDLQVRAICESLTADTRPISIVLTYNDLNLPIDGVNKEDVQKFLKRLRIELFRKYHENGYRDNLRYFCVAEYGEKRHRSHYHLVLWNMPILHNNPTYNLYFLKQLLEKVWSNGIVKIKYTDEPLNNNGKASVKAGVQYCVKYLNKDSAIPYRYVTQYDEVLDRLVRKPVPLNKPFMLLSRGRGEVQGLGSQWLFENADFILNNLNSLSSYTWTYNKETKTSCLPQYFIDKLWPSITRIVPKEIRDKFVLFQSFVPYLKIHSMDDYIQDLQNKYWFLPQPSMYCHYNFSDSEFLKSAADIITTLIEYEVPKVITNELINMLTDRKSFIADSLYSKDYPVAESYQRYYSMFFSLKPKFNYISDEE